jgi:hypothetical protein
VTERPILEPVDLHSADGPALDHETADEHATETQMGEESSFALIC